MAGMTMGWQRYLNLRKEVTWGSKDGSGTDLFIPYTSYDVSVKPQAVQAPLYVGVRQQKHNIITKATLDGTLAMPLWAQHIATKSIAQHMIEAAISGPASPFLDSFTAMLFDNGNDDKRHLGLRFGSLTIAGSADGDGIVTMTAALNGKEETNEGSPTSLSATAALPSAFTFDLVKLYLSSESEGESASSAGEEVAIRSFEIAINNNLQIYHLNSFFPGVIAAGVRTISVKFDIFKEDDTYDLLRRTSSITNRAAHLELKGYHGGTGASGTKTVMDVYFDRLNFANAADSSDLNQLIQQSTDWIALKPATTENDIEFAFSLE